MRILNNYRTLLLDSCFRPLRTFGWRRAVTLDVLDRVDVLEYYDEVVRTPTDEFPLPAVIRLRDFLRFLRFKVTFSRKNVFLRDDFRCQYCGFRPPIRQLTLDHVMPSSRGGLTTWENVAAACGPCNRRKGNRTPREARMPLARTPIQPRTLPNQHGVAQAGDIPSEWRLYMPNKP